jgi:type I restriction enzyme S subunit
LRAAQPHLNAKELGDTWVAVPPAEEQLAIADYLDEKTAAIDALIAKRERHIELLRERRNAVVTSYVLGLSEPTSGTHGSVEPPHLMRIVPNYWSVRRVKFVMERAVDCPHSTPEYDPDGEYPAVRTSDIEPGRLNLEGARRVSEAVYRERTNRLVPDGNDIIYSREGERFGMAALVPPRTKLCLAQRVMIFRPARVHCPRYVMWALNSSAFYEQVRQDTVGATSPRVNIPTILNAWVPVPPPAEQVEIAVRIESVVARFDALQELELRQMDKLREYRQTLISTAVMGQIPVRQEVPA